MTRHSGGPEGLPRMSHQQESLARTREKLEVALGTLVSAKKSSPGTVKINPSSVARAAGVDRATLYRYHASLLGAIESAQLAEPEEVKARAALRTLDLRKLAEDAQAEVAALARINYRLNAEHAAMSEALEQKDRIVADLRRQLAALALEHSSRGTLKAAK